MKHQETDYSLESVGSQRNTIITTRPELSQERLCEEELPFDRIKGNLIQALQWLAADAEEQIQVYAKHRRRSKIAAIEVPDELALMFEDSYVVVSQLADAGLVDEEQRSKLDEIDRLCARMSHEPLRQSVWSLDALRTDSHWTEVRHRAQEALRMFGQERACSTLFDRGKGTFAKIVNPLLVVVVVLLLVLCLGFAIIIIFR